VLGITVQDATLNWMRGQAYPAPPTELWMSVHSDSDAADGADISSTLGGRVRVQQANLSDPRYLDGQTSGKRQIVNLVAAVSAVASADAAANSFALWTAQLGGTRIISGTINPTVEITAGNPVLLLQGELSIRMS
jgi:hypothetical protein